MTLEFKTLHEDEDCWLGEYFDYTTRANVLGVKIYSWSPSKYKKFISILADILRKADKPYLSYVAGEKEKKFNYLFGFDTTGITFMQDGIEYEVLYVVP